MCAILNHLLSVSCALLLSIVASCGKTLILLSLVLPWVGTRIVFLMSLGYGFIGASSRVVVHGPSRC